MPELPDRLVSRPRLLATLDRACESLVTLVSAPAGAGKTLLLAEWVRTRGADETAWVSLDSDDNEDRRFWSVVLDAVHTTQVAAGDSTLPRLAVPPSPSADPGFLAEVVNALDDLPAPVLLILDDVHELTDRRPLRGLETLLQHQPAGLRLVLSTRHDPQLPLARLRLTDQLSEIRADHLRFTPGEARDLLVTSGIDLEPSQLHLLLEQTEGWAAGLRLAALSLSGATEPDRLLADFAGNNRAVADYLIDEVLSRLPGEARDLLDAICVCDETPANLAAHLSGRADAGAVLETITQRTSLVVRADPPGHRYHVHFLLRSYLLADLVRQVPDRVRELHGRAADWFAAHDEPAPALTHAEAAADVARVTALLHKDAVTLAYGGDHDLIRKALELLGARQVSADSLLALVSALLHLERGEPRPAGRDLAHACASWPEHPSGDLVSLRRLVSSRLALLGGGPDDLLRTAQSLDPRPGRPLDAAAQLLRASALITTGRRAAAREQLQAALRAAHDDEQDYVATLCQTLLGGLAALEGDVGSMVTLATAADEMNTRHGRQQTMNAAAASALLAYGALLRAEPAECLRRARQTLRLLEGRDPVALAGMDLVADILCGMAEFELGERIAGARRIHRARSTREALPFQAEQVALCALLEHHTALLVGWRQTASAALRWCQASAPDSTEVHLMRARTQLSLGRRDAAGKTIQPILTGSTPAVLPWSLIEAWLLSTEISVNDGDAAGARRSLEHALAVAQDLDVPYPIVVAVPEVIDLLTARLGKLGTAERFAGRVLTLRRELAVPPMVPMTARERAVLRLLPTQRSFEEIADDLTVSANTVKTHVRAIYAKLGVTHRRDAVAIALERGLLENEHSGC